MLFSAGAVVYLYRRSTLYIGGSEEQLRLQSYCIVLKQFLKERINVLNVNTYYNMETSVKSDK